MKAPVPRWSAVALARALGQPYAPTPEQVALEADDEPRWARDLLAVTADAMAGARYLATPGTHCGTCQVKDSCPARPEGRQL